MTQQQVADAVGTTRQTVNGWERRASMEDTRHLGKVFEVLGLGPDGLPRDTASLVAADLRSMSASDLIALQGRITAEFARRLGRVADPFLDSDAAAMPRPDLRENLGRYTPAEGRREG